VKRMTYTSNFARPLTRNEIDAIGEHSVRRNAEDGITGVLLTLGSIFFQIIEGGDEAIDDLYGRVLRDERHTDVICLSAEANVVDRLFPEWSMNVVDLDHLDGDALRPLKLLLGRMGEAQHIIERYTQPAVSRMMTRGLNPLHQPLRTVTRVVLFTDMVAFSAISDRLRIEKVAELVETYLETCSVCIARHGGEVTKFLGDGVLAYFDADEADDALQSCVDIQHELQQVRESAPVASPLRLLYSGCGLALGPVMEGSMGSSVKMEYTIIGEPVNTASKVEELTRRLEVPVLMTNDVVDAAERSWDTTLVGEFDVGRGDPTPLFSLRTGAERDGDGDMRSAVAQRLDAVDPAGRV
jgi:adenylate cyclase